MKKTIQCSACCHHCNIPERHTGICGVRKNVGEKLELLVYGKPVATHVDPIEKKPLFHFLPKTKIFSLGTIGCNFRCSFCQNWDISQSKTPYYSEEWSPERVVDYCIQNDIPSIAYTYNEPTIFIEYAYDIMQLAHENNIHNIFVSNGYFSEDTLDMITPYLDAINIDLKSFNETFYHKICGAHLEPILKNIKEIHKRNIWLELTTLIIPEENDSTEELSEITSFIA